MVYNTVVYILQNSKKQKTLPPLQIGILVSMLSSLAFMENTIDAQKGKAVIFYMTQ